MKYSLMARFYPAVISSVPFFVFQYCFFDKGLFGLFNYLINLKVVSDITLSIIILYLVALLARYIGRYVFEDKIFDNGKDFPTTRLLLYSDSTYSKYDKSRIRKKIENTFSLALPTENEEKNNEIETRKRISEAVALVRNKVKSGRLLIQHNVEYGFWRNLIGGSLISIVPTIINIVFAYSNNQTYIIYFGWLLLFLYSLLLLFGKKIIEYHGMVYARVLFTEFMSL